MRHRFDFSPIFAWLVAALFVFSGVPQLLAASTTLNYQGRVIANGVAFQGTGQFKFALISADGNTYYWKNDATTGSTAPASAVSLTVNRGLFSVRLGDTAIPNMASLDSAALADAGVKLRVWFNDGSKGFQQMNPDQRISPNASGFVAGGNSLYAAAGLSDPNGTLMFVTPGAWEKVIQSPANFSGYQATGTFYLRDGDTLYAVYTKSITSNYNNTVTTGTFGVAKYDIPTSKTEIVLEFAYQPSAYYGNGWDLFYNYGGKFIGGYVSSGVLWLSFTWSFSSPTPNSSWSKQEFFPIDLALKKRAAATLAPPSISLITRYRPTSATVGGETFSLSQGVFKQGNVDKHISNSILVPAFSDSSSTGAMFSDGNYVYIFGGISEWYRSSLSSLRNIFMSN